MRPIFDPNQPVFIVGGGASLRDFDFSRLRRQQVIALNLAFRPLPKAAVLFFGDNRFWERYKDPNGEHFWRFGKGKILTTASYCAGVSGRVEYVDPADLSVTKDDETVSAAGINTGAQAILLAHALGAQKIVLLGYDGRPGHWASTQPYAYDTTPSEAAFETYAAEFERIAGLGLDVVNATPRSALTCFPTATLDTLL